MKAKMDIVIPVLNEEKIFLAQEPYFTWLKSKARVIFVDGGSNDRTVVIAGNYGEVISSVRGRAVQMNAGAAVGKAEHILFVHADTFMSEEGWYKMEQTLANGVEAGCFSMVIQERGWIFRVFEYAVNLRARRFEILDGDLGLFIKRELFNRLNQFDQVRIMEDILFTKKLRKSAEVEVLPEKIYVSGRKWRENGFWPTFHQYSRAYLQLWTRIPFYTWYQHREA